MNQGDRIKSLRLQKGLTLEELGNLVGVGKSTVRKWETGDIENMRRDSIEKLSRALGVSPLYIMGISQDDRVAPDGSYSSFPKCLHKIREAAGFHTIPDFVYVFNASVPNTPITCSLVQEWEDGKTYPSNDMFVTLCDFFHVTADTMHGMIWLPDDMFVTVPEERRLLDLWRLADGIDKQTIWNILSRYDEEAASSRISTG